MQVVFDLQQPLKNNVALQIIAEMTRSDGTYFECKGGVNTHNCQIWSINIPQVNIQQRFKSTRLVQVLCFILGRYFFEQIVNGRTSTVTVTDQRYLNILLDYAKPLLQEHNIENIRMVHLCIPSIK